MEIRKLNPDEFDQSIKLADETFRDEEQRFPLPLPNTKGMNYV
ncbi:hypothetical protein [Virgibacillus profundi]|nr:hypothetical protein [Virgibacillus profundi]